MKCKRCEQPIRNFAGEEISDDIPWADQLCHRCWEVETRLADYLRYPKCLEFAENATAEAKTVNKGIPST